MRAGKYIKNNLIVGILCHRNGRGKDAFLPVFVGKIVGNCGKLFEGYCNSLK
tara:strand:+ start:569 stop:724 length:156 start_codon:yes stop_codon:yes gene_type:complete